jgi:outer membrane protein assembly factor BamB
VNARGPLLALGGVTIALAACGAQSSTSSRTASLHPPRPAARQAATAAIPAGDWPQFNFTAQRAGVGPNDTGITTADVSRLRLRRVTLPGVDDGSAIELHAIAIKGRRRDVLIVTTTYGRTLAADAATGQTLWEFTPSDIGSYQGSARITTATPTADPDRRYVYATSPDGVVHKLAVATGRQVRSGGWPVTVSFDPTREKLASPPSIDGSSLIVVTDGYFGDTPHYEGHVVKIDRATGRIEAVFNSLCSNRRVLIDPPSLCPASDSAIWGRAGAVVQPSGDILVATGNGAFNGSTDWGDSVLQLSPNLQLLHNWTPTDQQQLNAEDQDLGSTSPALLPDDLAVQGGKSGELNLLNLNALDGTTGPAGPRTGGQLQTISAPGPTAVFSEPAVWTSSAGRTYVFVADAAGTAAYVLGADHRLNVAWKDSTPGTSPVIAGGLLYVYNEIGGAIEIRRPADGAQLASLPVGTGHWSTPIVVGGRIILPTGGSIADNAGSGPLDIYHLPGR